MKGTTRPAPLNLDFRRLVSPSSQVMLFIIPGQRPLPALSLLPHPPTLGDGGAGNTAWSHTKKWKETTSLNAVHSACADTAANALGVETTSRTRLLLNCECMTLQARGQCNYREICCALLPHICVYTFIIYMYVYIYIYIYTYLYIHTHTRTYMYIYIYVYTYMYIYINYTHIYT